MLFRPKHCPLTPSLIMKPPTSSPLGKTPLLRNVFIASLLAFAGSHSPALATALYWDGNGTTLGAGTTPTGTWGTSVFWNTDSTGGGGGAFQVGTTIADDLYFSAGTDATGSYTTTLNGTRAARSLNFQYGTITLDGGIVQLGSGGVTVASTVAGNVTVKSSLTLEASQTWANNSSKALTFSTSAATLDTTLTTPIVITASANGSANINIQSNVLRDNNAAGGSVTSLVVDSAGGGTVSINAAQAYTGGTTVKRGILRTDIAGALGTGTVYLGDTSGSSSVALYNNGITLANDIVVRAGSSGTLSLGTLNAASNPAIYSGSVTLNNSNLVRVNAGSANTAQRFTGLISGSGGFYKDTEGFTLTITHANTYSGGTRFDKGTIAIGDDTALGTGALTFNNNQSSPTTSGTRLQSMDATAHTVANAIGNFGGSTANTLYIFGAAGTGSLNFTNSSASSLGTVVRVIQTESDTRFAAVFTGTGGITKTGSATLTLAGANTYSGATAVSAGTMLITGSTAGSSTVTVSAGAAVGGSGTILGSLSMVSGAKFVFSLVDTLNVNGSVTFGGFSIADIVGLSSDTAVATYNLIGGTGSINWANVSNVGEENAYDLGNGKSAYFEQSGLQVVVIPEPSSMALVALPGVALLAMRCARRKKA